MLNVIMLNVIMLNIIMMSDILRSVTMSGIMPVVNMRNIIMLYVTLPNVI
jgi:hypothetical protein